MEEKMTGFSKGWPDGEDHQPEEYYGLRIMSAKIDNDLLTLGLSNGKFIQIWDNGQSCCENRYMSTDDDVESLVGATLTKIETKPGPEVDDDDNFSVHEQEFVEVSTDKGFITIANHNEHNGYYGGFGLTITEGKI